MRSFSAELVFSLPTLHHNKMFPLYLSGVLKGSTAGPSRRKLTLIDRGIQQWINSFNKIRSDRTRMNGIGVTCLPFTRKLAVTTSPRSLKIARGNMKWLEPVAGHFHLYRNTDRVVVGNQRGKEDHKDHAPNKRRGRRENRSVPFFLIKLME